MKALISILMSIITGVSFAQTPVNKSYPVTAGQNISFKFDYPELIKISTWDKNEVVITGTININNGEHDNAFEFAQSNTGNTILLEGKIPNLKELPQRITVIDGKEKITFKTKEDYRRYCEEHNWEFNSISMGASIAIRLEIKIPNNIETYVESTYGLVEVKDFRGPIAVNATYGGIDATVPERAIGKLSAETSYGQIYSNLDVKFTGSEFKDFHTAVSAVLGNGPHNSFESKYGNIYLRK